MKVGRPNIGRLSNDEWFEFHTEFKNQTEHYTAERIGVKLLFEKYVLLYGKSDKILKSLQKSVYTKRLKAADRKRDGLFQGLYGMAKSSLHQPSADKREAGEQLHNLLRGYQKNIQHGNYVEQSGAIYNLLQDLKGSYKDAVLLLGFTDWVTAIDQAEQEFLSLESMREEESVEKPKEAMKTVRAQADRFYHAMINVLEAQLLADGLAGSVVVDPADLDDKPPVDGDDTSREFHGNVTYNFAIAWNVALRKYVNLLAQRAGRRARKDEWEDVASES
jgi:hypothetical protein